MKTIYARVTMKLTVTDEEYEQIVAKSKGTGFCYGDVDLDTINYVEMKHDDECDDSYIPGPWLEDIERR